MLGKGSANRVSDRHEHVLKELSLLRPLQEEEAEVLLLNRIEDFRGLPVNIVITLGSANLGRVTGFFHLRKLSERTYQANLVYDKSLDEKFSEDHYSSVRKLAIIHEYLHLIAFIELLEKQPRLIEPLFEDRGEGISKVVLYNEIISLLDSIEKRDFKKTHFSNEHFRYFEGDNNLYNFILVNLLLPKYSMEKCFVDQNENFPLREAIKSPALLTNWIKDIFQICISSQKIQVKGSAGLLGDRVLTFAVEKIVELGS